jgi:hypothetical protein
LNIFKDGESLNLTLDQIELYYAQSPYFKKDRNNGLATIGNQRMQINIPREAVTNLLEGFHTPPSSLPPHPL